jgi:hypothetical protein
MIGSLGLGILAIMAFCTALSAFQTRFLLKYVEFRMNSLTEDVAEAFTMAIDGRIEQLATAIDPPNPWAAMAAQYLQHRMGEVPVLQVTEVQSRAQDGKFTKDTSLNTEWHFI